MGMVQYFINTVRTQSRDLRLAKEYLPLFSSLLREVLYEYGADGRSAESGGNKALLCMSYHESEER